MSEDKTINIDEVVTKDNDTAAKSEAPTSSEEQEFNVIEFLKSMMYSAKDEAEKLITNPARLSEGRVIHGYLLFKKNSVSQEKWDLAIDFLRSRNFVSKTRGLMLKLYNSNSGLEIPTLTPTY